jgi:glycosyltransferase involved in cell wall biosynthesis
MIHEPTSNPLLTVAIPTIVDREAQFKVLVEKLQVMAEGYPVEIIFCRDNKEMTIGAKRQLLLEKANGKWITMLDDDDMYHEKYFKSVMPVLQEHQKPDVVTYLERVYTAKEDRHLVPKPKLHSSYHLASHRLHYEDWWSDMASPTIQHFRTPFYKDVIKTSIARQIGFNKALSYGEDHDFARRLKASGLLLKEVYIPEELYFYYQPPALNQQQLKERYGMR